MFEATGDEAKSQGWTALILDTNGNGKRDDYVEPNQPVDPTRDTRIAAAFYGVAPSPIDGTVWGSVLGFPGAIVRLNPGTNPPATALAEIYEPPTPGYSPRLSTGRPRPASTAPRAGPCTRFPARSSRT